MAFCGSSLKSVTNCAAVFTLINFIFFIFLDIFLIICLRFPDVFDQEAASPGFKSFLVGFNGLNQSKVLWILIIIRLILRLCWLVSAPILAIGNRIEKQSYFNSWIFIGLTITFFASFTAIYFLIVHYECGFLGDFINWTKSLTSANPDPWAGREAARFIVFLALFDFGLLFYLPSIILIILVHRRGIQIRYKKREDRLIDSWSYELQPYRIPRVRLNQETQRNGTAIPPLPVQLTSSPDSVPLSSPGTLVKSSIEPTPVSMRPSHHESRSRHRPRHHHHRNHNTYHSRQRPATMVGGSEIPSISGNLDGSRRSSSTGHLVHESSATIYFEPNQSRTNPYSFRGYDNENLTDDAGNLMRDRSKTTSFLADPQSPPGISFNPAAYGRVGNENHLQPIDDRFGCNRKSSLQGSLI